MKASTYYVLHTSDTASFTAKFKNLKEEIVGIFLDRKYVFRVCVPTFSFLASVLHFDNIAFDFKLRSPFEISEEIPYVENQMPL